MNDMPVLDTPSPAAAAAELEKLRQETRKAAAEALKAERDVAVPELPKELPTGALTVSSTTAFPAGALAAYSSLDTTCDKIRRYHVPSDAVGVWIVPFGHHTRCAAAFDLVGSRLRHARTRVASAAQLLAPPSPEVESQERYDEGAGGLEHLVALPAVAKVLSVAASTLPLLASLGKTNTTVSSAPLMIPFSALSASMVGAYTRGRGVRSPQGSEEQPSPTVRVAGDTVPLQGELRSLLYEIIEERDALAQSLMQYKIDQQTGTDADEAVALERIALAKVVAGKAEISDLGVLLDCVSEAARTIVARREIARGRAQTLAEVEKVIELVDTVVKEVLMTDGAGQSPLQLAHEYEERKDWHVLQIEMSYAATGSDWEDRQIAKDRGHHLGASVVTFTCCAPDGTIVSSGALEGYRSVKTTVGELGLDWDD